LHVTAWLSFDQSVARSSRARPTITTSSILVFRITRPLRGTRGFRRVASALARLQRQHQDCEYLLATCALNLASEVAVPSTDLGLR